MLTAEQFRGIVLRMDGASESAHMGHPDFRANGRIFATLYPDGESGMVKLTPEQQQEFMHRDSVAFAPAQRRLGSTGLHDREVGGAGCRHARRGNHTRMVKHQEGGRC